MLLGIGATSTIKPYFDGPNRIRINNHNERRWPEQVVLRLVTQHMKAKTFGNDQLYYRTSKSGASKSSNAEDL